MKNFFINLIALISLTSSVALAQGTSPRFRSDDFMAANQSIFITNNTVYTNGQSSILYSNALGNQVFSLTNLYVYGSNSYVANGTLGTNSSVVYPSPWQDLPNFSDMFGNNSSGAFMLSFHGLTARSTNTVTFNFVGLGRGAALNGSFIGSLPVSSGYSTNIVVASLGLTNTTIIAPISTSLVQGNAGWRLNSITVSDAGAAASIVIDFMRLNGFRP